MFRPMFVLAALGSAALAALAVTVGSAAKQTNPGLVALASVKHIVVIYEENHSFDNLYGGWEGVNGLSNAAIAPSQVNQNGLAFTCLMHYQEQYPKYAILDDFFQGAFGGSFLNH
jgi:phospholipase C